MRLSTRLLFTLIFCALILPKAIEFLGGHDAQLGKKSIAYQEEQTIQKITNQQESYKQQLLTNLDDLKIRDEKFKECIVSNISKYFGLTDSSSGKIESPTELGSILCDGIVVNSVSGIEKFKKLKFISLRGSDINNVAPLSRVLSLSSIDLSDGNTKIHNIGELAQLNSLKNIQFPDLEENYCYEAENVVFNMKENFGREARHNFKNIKCRGKNVYRISKIRKKLNNNELLSPEESDLWRDFQTNEDWRKK